MSNETVNCHTHPGADGCVQRDHGEEGQVMVGVVVAVVSVLLLYLVHRYWSQQQIERQQATGLLSDSNNFAMHLVRHFMPSMKVAKYQFRGMQPPPVAVDISFRDLGLVLHSGVKVLNGVTGEFKAGRMCALMGPSGAGKTTFMNTLCGKAAYGKMSGKIFINGHNLSFPEINSVVGFVPQDDIVHETLTVREQIRFSAELRNKVGTSKRRIEHIVDDVLAVMQIDHIQNSIVGGVEHRGISGGQRKRVNIGLELAAQPTVLFLDEPTSGLDSTSSLSVVYSLKKMCQLGMNCIMVIHQPRYSLFTLFDDVLLLGKGGYAVYLGESLGAKGYFEGLGFEMPEGENRADWFMDVISGEVPNPKIANFEPKMLFTMWEQRTGRTNAGAADEEAGDTKKGAGRDLTEAEDLAVLSKALEDEWDRIDINRDGYMDKDELKALLASSSNVEPSDEVVGEIFQRMAGAGGNVVTRKEFLSFLTGLKSDVAQDRLVTDSMSQEHGAATVLDTVAHGIGGWRNKDRKGTMSQNAEESSTEESSGGSSAEEDGIHTYGRAGALRALSRHTPGYFMQLQILLTRTLIQWWRKNQSRAIYFAAMGVGALVLAAQDIIVGTAKWDAMTFVNTHTCVGLLTAIFCLNIFGENQPVFWRERNRGLNVLAHFMSKANMNLTDLWMQCFLFTALYYVIRGLHVSFFMYWIPYLLVSYAASGWGYAISAWLPVQHGPFIASLIIFVVCGLLGNPMNLAQFLENPVLEAITSIISITRWSIPMSFLMQIKRTDPHPEPNTKDAMLYTYYKAALTSGTWSNEFGFWWTGIIALGIYGSFLRMVAYLGLLYRNRDKQV